jgi:iron only hydrogenase large subunit-like protein
MRRIQRQIKETVLLVELLSPQSRAALNSVFGTSYEVSQVKQSVTVQRKEQSFSFWDRLMRTVPGFEGENEEAD